MSLAWEITEDDVANVLDAHGVDYDEDTLETVLDELDHDAIEKGLLCYTDMDDQTASVLDDIENHLIEKNLISGEKQFNPPE